jgi:hypothetical protein
MGDVAAAAAGCGPRAAGARPGRARSGLRAGAAAFVALWQTLTGLAWLAGRIARGFGQYHQRCEHTPRLTRLRPTSTQSHSVAAHMRIRDLRQLRESDAGDRTLR